MANAARLSAEAFPLFCAFCGFFTLLNGRFLACSPAFFLNDSLRCALRCSALRALKASFACAKLCAACSAC